MKPNIFSAWRAAGSVGPARLGGVLALAVGLGALTGCIQIEQTLTLHPDGTGVFQIYYSMSEQSIAQMQAMQTLARQIDVAQGKKDPAPDLDLTNPYLFDEQSIRQLFAKYQANGISLEDVKIASRGTWKTADLTVQFKSLAELAKIELLANSGFSLSRTPDKNYKIVLQAPTDRDISLTDPDVEKSLTPVLAGFKLKATINTPSKLLETNASRHSSRSATWDVDFDNDPRQLAKLQRDGVFVVFDGSGLNLPEVGQPPQRAAAAHRPASSAPRAAPAR